MDGWVQGDDYVLYCHPPKQKNPKADKLRDWYHSLCEKGINRDLVVMRSTIFDRFMAGGKHNAIMEPSTTMLPYFDGDYWPGDAENQLAEMEKGVATGQSAWLFYCLLLPCSSPHRFFWLTALLEALSSLHVRACW